ncbi:MAG TPA: hypothetical protein VFM18_12260, partial [Methanosarcina sp.]|nr:hypothetical protein [Methanosarcina sp.]
NVATIKALDRVKELPEYKKATKKERTNMETAVKEMVLDVMKKDYIRKNREQLLQQIKPEDNSVKEAKQRVKGVVEGYDEGRRRPSRKRER